MRRFCDHLVQYCLCGGGGGGGDGFQPSYILLLFCLIFTRLFFPILAHILLSIITLSYLFLWIYI